MDWNFHQAFQMHTLRTCCLQKNNTIEIETIETHTPLHVTIQSKTPSKDTFAARDIEMSTNIAKTQKQSFVLFHMPWVWDATSFKANNWSWGLSIGTADGLFPSDCFIMGDGEVLRMLRQEWNITKQLLIISLMLRWVLQKLPGIAWWHREAFKLQALLTCTLRC